MLNQHVNHLPAEWRALLEVYDLMEGSKLQVLKDKVKLTDEVAEFFDELYAGLAVIIANGFIGYVRDMYKDAKMPEVWEPSEHSGKIDHPQFLQSFNSQRQNFILVRDWIQAGLNGNFQPWKQKKFVDWTQEAYRWHQSLQQGEGELNYQEENPIILDYRKDDGLGFYWADLETTKCGEEADRMGHCGTSGVNGTLYSLRSYSSAGQGYTKNQSHVTAAVGDNGIIYQMKGPKNSKPKQEYHEYIIDLILNHEHIQGFGSEYQSGSDFTFTDLTKEQIRKIYEARPELFKRRREKRALVEIGVLKKEDIPNAIVELKLWQDEWDDWISVPSRSDMSIDSALKLLDGEGYDWIWDQAIDFNNAWEYYINGKNKGKIRQIIHNHINDMDADSKKAILADFPDGAETELKNDDGEYELELLIENLGLEEDIILPVRDAYIHGLESAYYDEIIKRFQKVFDEQGKTSTISRETTQRYNSKTGKHEALDLLYIEITVDLIKDQGLSDEEIESLIEDYDLDEDDYEVILKEAIYQNYTDKWEVDFYRIDDYIDVSAQEYNTILDSML